MRQPDYQCSRCGIDLFLVPPKPWIEVAHVYARAGLRVYEPTCGECVMQNVRIYWDSSIAPSRAEAPDE